MIASDIAVRLLRGTPGKYVVNMYILGLPLENEAGRWCFRVTILYLGRGSSGGRVYLGEWCLGGKRKGGIVGDFTGFWGVTVSGGEVFIFGSSV